MQTENMEILQQFLARGGSIRMLKDIDQHDLDRLYAYANQLFETGEFGSARNIYYVLVRIDHWNFDYWLALGLCYQRLNLHEEALSCFGRAGMIGVVDPRSAFFAGLSYQMLGNAEYARRAFKTATRLCGQAERHEAVRRAAAQMLAHGMLGV